VAAIKELADGTLTKAAEEKITTPEKVSGMSYFWRGCFTS
jgi:hypothetical protein